MGAGCTRGAKSAAPTQDTPHSKAESATSKSTSSSSKAGATPEKKDAAARPGSYRVAPDPAATPVSPKASSRSKQAEASAEPSSPQAPRTGKNGSTTTEVTKSGQDELLDGPRDAGEADKTEEPALPQSVSEATVVRAGVRGEDSSKSLGRCLSVRSQEAMSTLGQLQERLKKIEDRVAELDAIVRSPEAPSSIGKVKTELAMLEADAHKLESSGVDNVYTGELESGKDSAKEAKRDQLRRLEALFTRIDEVFQFITQGNSAAAPTPVATDTT